LIQGHSSQLQGKEWEGNTGKRKRREELGRVKGPSQVHSVQGGFRPVLINVSLVPGSNVAAPTFLVVHVYLESLQSDLVQQTIALPHVSNALFMNSEHTLTNFIL